MISMDEKEFHETFKILKPVCDAFITDPNDANTALFKNALDAAPKYGVELLHHYVLIPLEINLNFNAS